MIRAITAALLVASIGAPLQCGSGSKDGVRREDTAGDALYALAEDFRAKGNEQAAHDTLRYLVEHYPSNRHAPAAREELGRSAGADGAKGSAGADGAKGSAGADGAKD